MQVIGEWDSRAVASAFTFLKEEAEEEEEEEEREVV